MTPKRQRFVEQYLVDLNATRAYAAAGFKGSENVCAVEGHKLLRNPEIAVAIQKAMKKRSERTEITADRVLAELAKIGFANMQDYMRAGPDGDPFLDFSQLTREQAAALAEVTVEDFKEGRGENARDVRRVKFKLADKRAALVDIGKHLGMFKDRIEHSGPNGGPIVNATVQEVLAALPAIEDEC